MSSQNEAARLPPVFETLIVSDSGDDVERPKLAARRPTTPLRHPTETRAMGVDPAFRYFPKQPVNSSESALDLVDQAGKLRIVAPHIKFSCCDQPHR